MNRPEDGPPREAHCMARNPFDKRARNRLLGGLAGRYIRFVERSSTLVPGSDDATAVMAAHHPAIIAMWHGEFMLVAPLAPKGFGFANMVARHGDAELIGTALETFDMTLVRGGGAAGRRRDRGGTRAFLEALRLLENGTSITMTADVPPGTPRRAGLGIIKLAQKSGRPIIPIAVASSRFVTVDTWSRMTVNLPASRLSLVTGDPVTVDAAADAAELEAARAQLEAKLDDATRRAYKLVGADATQATPAAGFKVGDPHPRPGLPLKVYSAAARALAGTVPAVLSYREKKGKEDPRRRNERLGISSLERPPGSLIWLHAASVGETNSILPLMETLRRHRPDCRFLLTTGTVTSANLVQSRLGPGDTHQYATLDVPLFVNRFLDHWRPDLAVLTESEIWPNMILAASERDIPFALVNARMSDRSYRRWRRYRRSARALLGRLRIILTQNDRLARRFRELGGRDVRTKGNLKVDAPPLAVDAAALDNLRDQVAGRPVFLAASTHPGEETILFDAFATIRASLPDTLLIVVPRHADRGADIAREAEAAGLTVARRSEGHPVESGTAVHVADTMGELGLFYSLSDAAFIGGSLVPHGGQNPLEAVRLGTAVLSGPHHANFADTFRDLSRREAAIIVHDAEGLASATLNALLDADMREALTLRAQSAIAEMAGALDATTEALLELLPEPDIEVETAEPQGAAARTTRKLSRAS